MAAILPDDDATTYFGTSVWTHAKQRIPWLLILMLSATFTGMVTTHYEEAFVSLPLLVSFMPMLMDTAGNCGNQISTLMVRGLALGEVEPADFVRVLGKELRVSAIVGAVLGIVNGLRIYLMYTFLFPGQYANVMGYAIVVSVSLFFSVILAKLVGGMLPLAAKKLGADRTAGIPQYDVKKKAMPDGLEVTARHFYRTNPLSHRCAMPTPSVKT